MMRNATTQTNNHNHHHNHNNITFYNKMPPKGKSRAKTGSKTSIVAESKAAIATGNNSNNNNNNNNNNKDELEKNKNKSKNNPFEMMLSLKIETTPNDSTPLSNANSISALLDRPEVFFQPQPSIASALGQTISQLYNLGRSSSLPTFRQLPPFILQGFDIEQLWAELQLQNDPVSRYLKSRLPKVVQAAESFDKSDESQKASNNQVLPVSYPM